VGRQGNREEPEKLAVKPRGKIPEFSRKGVKKGIDASV
jgi:hypothetical protein